MKTNDLLTHDETSFNSFKTKIREFRGAATHSWTKLSTLTYTLTEN